MSVIYGIYVKTVMYNSILLTKTMKLDQAPIKTITLVDQAEEQILRYIVNQKLTVGCVIPSELDLTRSLNVGRTVVREALSRLKMLGIIESRKHKGMVLCEPSIMKTVAKVVNPYLLSKQSILDLLDLRVALEVGISRLVVSNITDKEIEALQMIVSKHEYLANYDTKVENEIEFHSFLYRVTRNQAIIELVEIVIPLFSYVYENLGDFKLIKQKQVEKPVNHEDLLIFLKNRDLQGYRDAIYIHLKAYSEYARLHRIQTDV